MITLRRVLVPTDFSETSDAAVTYGVALARGFNAKLYVLHVLDRTPAETTGGTEYPLGLFESMQDAARGYLSKTLTEQQVKELRAEFETRVGAPYAEIVRYAQDRDVDLIVMGTHGRGFVAHMLMGSVAEKVVRRAPCPVLTVRHPHHKFVIPEETEQEAARGAS